MTLLPERETSFVLDDIRGQLRAWMKDNCHSRLDFLKEEVERFKLWEALSSELAQRKNYGLKLSEIQFDIRTCGKWGEWQRHKKTGEERAIGHYCNERSYHLPCTIRYRKGQGIESRNQFMEIAEGNNLWGFYDWAFTLPREVRSWIDKNQEQRKNFLSDARRVVAKTIKEILGLNTKSRNIQPGFQVLYHPVSSGNPFKQASHFHALVLPLLADLKNGKTYKFKKTQSPVRAREIYKKYLDPVFKKYGLQHLIKDVYVVHLRYVEGFFKGSVNHAFIYNNRSQVEDVLKTIKRIHYQYERFVILLYDKKREVFVPHIKSLDEMLKALEFVLNPLIPVRISYGFMRVLQKYSLLLGIERDEYQEDENWETLYRIEILRQLRHAFNKDTDKILPFFTILIRKKDSCENFRKLKPDEVKGERACLSKRKLFKATR